jgi:hypothetical protein
MKTKFLAAIVAALVWSVASARADTLTYDFGNPPDVPSLNDPVLGKTASYTVKGVTITAAGFDLTGSGTTAGNALNLYRKDNETDENGLGIANVVGGHSSPNNEINTTDFVQLDVSKLLAFRPFSLTISSLQGNSGLTDPAEAFYVYGSNDNGVMHTANLIGSGNGDQTSGNSYGTFSVADLASYKYLDITAAADDVLLSSLSVNTVPEPTSLILFGMGAVGIAGYGWRRRKAALA